MRAFGAHPAWEHGLPEPKSHALASARVKDFTISKYCLTGPSLPVIVSIISRLIQTPVEDYPFFLAVTTKNMNLGFGFCSCGFLIGNEHFEVLGV